MFNLIKRITITLFIFTLVNLCLIAPVYSEELSEKEEFKQYQKFLKMKKAAGIDENEVRNRDKERKKEEFEEKQQFHRERIKLKICETYSIGADFNTHHLSVRTTYKNSGSYYSSDLNSYTGLGLNVEVNILEENMNKLVATSLSIGGVGGYNDSANRHNC